MKLVRTIGLGLMAAVMYAAVFINVVPVMKWFTKGGIFATLPILTVFAVSFVYAAFASNLWSLLGIEATKRIQPRATSRPRVRAERLRQRPRLHLEMPYEAK